MIIRHFHKLDEIGNIEQKWTKDRLKIRQLEHTNLALKEEQKIITPEVQFNPLKTQRSSSTYTGRNILLLIQYFMTE